MPTDVVMPQMGESIVEGTITKWLKKAGDTVEKDEPLFEISTDKVDAEIPSPAAGVLTEIKVAEGATVGVNTVVAVIADAASLATADPSAEKLDAEEGRGPQRRVLVAGVEEGGFNLRIKPSELKRAIAPDESFSASAAKSDSEVRRRSSPLVRRMAEDNNLDLAQIAGTGSEGRITKEDVLRHLGQRGPGGAAPAVPAAASLPGHLAPLTRMRAIIAQRMVESVQISPHVHTVYKVDMTRVVRIRQREKAGFEQRHGVKLTFMPFIAKAVVEALRKFPIVNAAMEKGPDGSNNSIRYHEHINLGIAVALEWGLIVPVVREAEGLSFLDLARAIADLASRARTKKLMPEEVTGSTFTLTNSGIFGDEFSTPIINQPESAILCISGLKKEAVVLTDTEDNDTIAIRSMQHFCLGFDHRTIDGADACKFMVEFKRTLESWDREIG
jgi:2-oxoglutarate dehydrogenase E2 component (dihydrolipoamide succinyltransferase)